MAPLNPDDIRAGPRMDNVLRDADFAQANNWGHVDSAGGYAGPPRWTRDSRNDGDNERFARSPITFGWMGWDVPFYVAYHAILVSWFPPAGPATVLAVVCLAVSRTVRGHAPDDTRYAGLRAALQITTFVVLSVRFVSELVFGFEANCWWLIYKLPDSVRLWGDLDSTLRLLLADPLGLILAILLASDLWVPQRARSVLMGGGFWTRYLAPPQEPELDSTGSDFFYILTFLLLATPKTLAESAYALALGLGVSFIAAYIIMVESADILSVRRQSPSARARWFSRQSDRRYQPLTAIGSGLPRLLIPLACGIVSVWFAGPGPFSRLLPIAAVFVGIVVAWPRHFALSWQVVQTFAAYPGHLNPRAGVHDLSPGVRNASVRSQLLRLAVLSWVPFVHCLVSGLLPGLPSFDGWAIVWPDLLLKSSFIGIALLVFVPPQMVCGVLRVGFGPLLDRFVTGGRQK